MEPSQHDTTEPYVFKKRDCRAGVIDIPLTHVSLRGCQGLDQIKGT